MKTFKSGGPVLLDHHPSAPTCPAMDDDATVTTVTNRFETQQTKLNNETNIDALGLSFLRAPSRTFKTHHRSLMKSRTFSKVSRFFNIKKVSATKVELNVEDEHSTCSDINCQLLNNIDNRSTRFATFVTKEDASRSPNRLARRRKRGYQIDCENVAKLTRKFVSISGNGIRWLECVNCLLQLLLSLPIIVSVLLLAASLPTGTNANDSVSSEFCSNCSTPFDALWAQSTPANNVSALFGASSATSSLSQSESQSLFVSTSTISSAQMFDDENSDDSILDSSTPITFQADPVYVAFRDTARFWVQRVLVPFIMVIGVVGNSITVVIMTRRRMRTSTNWYLAALACADIIYLVFTFILSLKHYPNAHHSDYYLYWYCFPFSVMIADAASNSSVWLTVTFTIERYIAVCHPIKGKVICTESRAKRVIFCVFLICVSVTVPTPFEWIVIEKFDLSTNSTKFQADESELAKNETYQTFYYHFNVFVFILLPLVLLVIFNNFLIRSVHLSNKQRAQMMMAKDTYQPRSRSESGNGHQRGQSQPSNQVPPPPSSHQSPSAASRQEIRITVMLIAVVILFLFCQTPTAFILIYRVFNQPSVNGEFILTGLQNIFNFLMSINAAGNFVLYCLLSQKYRRTFLNMFCRCFAPRHYTNPSVCTRMNAMESVVGGQNAAGGRYLQVPSFKQQQRFSVSSSGNVGARKNSGFGVSTGSNAAGIFASSTASLSSGDASSQTPSVRWKETNSAADRNNNNSQILSKSLGAQSVAKQQRQAPRDASGAAAATAVLPSAGVEVSSSSKTSLSVTPTAAPITSNSITERADQLEHLLPTTNSSDQRTKYCPSSALNHGQIKRTNHSHKHRQNSQFTDDEDDASIGDRDDNEQEEEEEEEEEEDDVNEASNCVIQQ